MKTKLLEQNIDICCVQEFEIPHHYPIIKALSFKNYNIKVEVNTIKSRCCFHIKDNINERRREDLEGTGNNIIIIELDKSVIITLYRSFAKQNNLSPFESFTNQVQIFRIKKLKFLKHNGIGIDKLQL